MQKVKQFLRRVEGQMNRKGFNIPVKNKARVTALLQQEYMKMLEETLESGEAPAPVKED